MYSTTILNPDITILLGRENSAKIEVNIETIGLHFEVKSKYQF